MQRANVHWLSGSTRSEDAAGRDAGVGAGVGVGVGADVACAGSALVAAVAWLIWLIWLISLLLLVFLLLLIAVALDLQGHFPEEGY
jgi:hypothetical protein